MRPLHADLHLAPFRASIRVNAYQIDPLHVALRLPHINLFVGLGKTDEAATSSRANFVVERSPQLRAIAPGAGCLLGEDPVAVSLVQSVDLQLLRLVEGEVRAYPISMSVSLETRRENRISRRRFREAGRRRIGVAPRP